MLYQNRLLCSEEFMNSYKFVQILAVHASIFRFEFLGIADGNRRLIG
jgi:hypothetical protein